MIPEIMDIITKSLSAERENTREIVESIIEAEQNYLFTNDLNYKENRSDIVAGNENQGTGGPGGHEQMMN